MTRLCSNVAYGQSEDTALSFLSIELESSSFLGELRRENDSKKNIIQIPISQSFKLESEIDMRRPLEFSFGVNTSELQ